MSDLNCLNKRFVAPLHPRGGRIVVCGTNVGYFRRCNSLGQTARPYGRRRATRLSHPERDRSGASRATAAKPFRVCCRSGLSRQISAPSSGPTLAAVAISFDLVGDWILNRKTSLKGGRGHGDGKAKSGVLLNIRNLGGEAGWPRPPEPVEEKAGSVHEHPARAVRRAGAVKLRTTVAGHLVF